MPKLIPALVILFFLSFSPIYAPKPSCYLLTLSEAESGRLIYFACLNDGEKVIYEWRNSLFGLNVTEVFEVSGGSLVLMELVYHDPYGNPEPLANLRDLEYLCHEGGPFRAVNISKAYSEVTFMVGSIGKPRITVRGTVLDLEREVGFGGRVTMRLSQD